MAVFQLLAIQSPTATGQVTYSHSLGVTPKAVIALSSWLGSVDVIDTHAAIMVGVSDGTNQFSASFVSADSAATSNALRVVSNSLIHQVDFNGGTLFRANLTAWDAISFTLNWTATTNSRRVELLLIGGSDVQAKALTFNSPTATGSQMITGVGFAPDAVVFLNAGSFSNALGTPQVHGALGLGVAERFTPAQWAVEVISVDNAAVANTQRIQDNTAAIIAVSSTLAVAYRAVLQSWDTDGVTLNWTTLPAATCPQAALFLKGLRLKAGTFTASTGSGSQSVTGVGFTPEMLLAATIWSGTTNGSGQDFARLSVGLATGPTAEASVNAYDQNAADPTIAKSYHATTRLLVKHTTAVERTFDLTSFDADGFTGSWSATGTGDQIGYLALASVTTVSVSASDSGLLSASESSFVQASFSVSDSSLLSALESPRISLSQPDSGLLSALEEAQVALLLQPSDSGTLTASETWVLTAQVSTGESPLLGSAEAYELALRSQDSHLLSATEAHQVVLSLAETGQLLSQESPGITVRASESALLSATEQSSAGDKFGEDDHVLSATEGASAQTLLQVSDSGTIGSVESGTVSVGITAQDSGTVLATESLALEVAASDEGQVRSLEQPQVRPERVTRGLASGELRTTRVETEWGTSRLGGELSASRILMTLEVDP